MIYCTYCLQPDTRPNTHFSESGLCPACQFFFGEKRVQSTTDRLTEILERITKNKESGSVYDAVLGVSGGKDSTKLATIARDRLGLRMLLVTVAYPPDQISKLGAENLSNLADMGFDVVSIAPSTHFWKELMRKSFVKEANWAQSTELALFSGVPQLALREKIPAILWGENPGLQLGDLGTVGNFGWDGNNLRGMNTLTRANGTLIDALVGASAEALPYKYPSAEVFQRNGLQIYYLGWAFSVWSLIDNGIFSTLRGLKPRADAAKDTGDPFGITSLDEDWVTLNQMIKYYKFGFGRATDYANELIRSGRLSRTEGIELVREYDGACSEANISSFCEYLDLSVEFFWQKVRQVTSSQLFEVSEGSRPTPRFKIGQGL